ncbi:MAG: radical SAM protein [Candidatus Neomarinimicrobiota bacterium]|tara:strand:+ start:4868 stop:5503 length:636 start_codon:yes stop_codon:yes gene_type:complete
MIKINEIFYSIQGESSMSGMPCIFIRLTYCNLRCSYCDTEYSFHEGKDMSIDDILKKIKNYNCKLVEVTGGEPLLQKESIDLMTILLNDNYKVMLETGGSLPIKNVPKDVIKIVDFKCPSSNMHKKNDWNILKDLQKHDEIKFVIGNYEDYEWTKNKINSYNLNTKRILLSPVHDVLKSKDLSEWILKDGINARLQLQLHKYIWSPDTKGV